MRVPLVSGAALVSFIIAACSGDGGGPTAVNPRDLVIAVQGGDQQIGATSAALPEPLQVEVTNGATKVPAKGRDRNLDGDRPRQRAPLHAFQLVACFAGAGVTKTLTPGAVAAIEGWRVHRRRSATVPKSRIVLVADPDSDARAIVRAFFEARQVVVHEAGGVRCLSAACRLRPDVIILGLGLPPRRALASIRALHTDRRTISIPIAVCTSLPFSDLDEQARQAGATLVLPKPVPPAELFRHIETLAGWGD